MLLTSLPVGRLVRQVAIAETRLSQTTLRSLYTPSLSAMTSAPTDWACNSTPAR